MTTSYLSVPDALKQFYNAEYLYNVSPLDVVSDTLGVLYGKRRNLSVLRRLYAEEDSAWRDLLPAGTSLDAALGIRKLMFNRLAVSRTRSHQPITLAPLGLELVGDPHGDKPVANAFRSVGSIAARFFTPKAREQLQEHVGRWAEQPLARLARAVLAYADRRASAKAVAPSAPVTRPDENGDTVAREDIEHLMTAWGSNAFGPEQQLDQLRTLLCFHLVLHAFRRAAGPLEHREGDAGTRLFFICDAAQAVGSPIAGPAYQSLTFWMTRAREASLALSTRSAKTLRESDAAAWDRLFAEINAMPPKDREAAIAKRAETIGGWAFPDDRRKRGRSAQDFIDNLGRELGLAYGRNPRAPGTGEQVQAVGQALYDVFSARGRVLHKLGEFLRGNGDGGGLIGPKGSHQRKRFLLRADLLEALTVVHTARARAGRVANDDDQLATGTVLDEWFERYGIVVDPSRPRVKDAVDGGEVDVRIRASLPDASLGAENVRELEDRLVELRLARRFSDASVSLDDSALHGSRDEVLS